MHDSHPTATTASARTASARTASARAASPSLVDQLGRPLRDLRVSVTDRCNFRCGYCMPAAVYADETKFLPSSHLLSFAEIERVVRLAVTQLGVEKVRLTGGEPLLRPDLPQLVAALARIPGLADLTLTTNGYLLAEHARAFADAGLNRLTVSLDSLDAAEFAAMSGAQRKLERVLAGLDAAVASGLSPLKLNCVVIRGQNDSSVVALAERFRGTPHVLRFIEYMDVGTVNGWQASAVVPAREILDQLAQRWPVHPLSPTYAGEVAQRYAYDDGQGEIGMIASVTAPFCGDCHRARLSADGRLLTCLFATGGFSMRDALRAGASDASLLARVRELWQARTDRYSEQRAAPRTGTGRRRLEMYQIGG